MQRRDFLRRLTATAAGLLVADDVLAMIAEPRRKVWPVGVQLTDNQEIAKLFRKIQGHVAHSYREELNAYTRFADVALPADMPDWAWTEVTVPV